MALVYIQLFFKSPTRGSGARKHLGPIVYSNWLEMSLVQVCKININFDSPYDNNIRTDELPSSQEESIVRKKHLLNFYLSISDQRELHMQPHHLRRPTLGRQPHRLQPAPPTDRQQRLCQLLHGSRHQVHARLREALLEGDYFEHVLRGASVYRLGWVDLDLGSSLSWWAAI